MKILRKRNHPVKNRRKPTETEQTNKNSQKKCTILDLSTHTHRDAAVICVCYRIITNKELAINKSKIVPEKNINNRINTTNMFII